MVLLSVVSILLAAGAGGWVWLGRSLPVVEGRLAVAGLRAPVEVARDRHGIPRITAGGPHDAYFALGFVHAQDRLWQMEAQRRLGAGRLAELVGEAAVPTDRFMRILGLYRLAEGSLAAMSPEARAVFEAYAAGVNAFLAQGRTLPPEFLVLRHRPEAWAPADSLVWGRLMAMRLSGNWREELLRARLPAEKARMLWPDYPADGPTTLDTALDGAAERLLAAMPEAVRPVLASNVWVLGGRHTHSGKPLLVNDPHLPFEAPVLWYLARLEMPGLSLTGATVPGVPLHLLGQNGAAAWGITTTHGDTMDLFVEREAAGGDGRAYQTPDGPLPFATRDEVIRVRDGADVVVTVRATRHGPIVVEDPPMALSATALLEGDRTAEAIWRINHAGSWAEFVHTPQQNIAWAGSDGTIGFVVAGRVPRRKAGDGTLPRSGWSGEFDWNGWVPFEELPRLVDPPSGRIVNANNKPVPEGYPHLLAADWPDPHRARRIGALLDGLRQRAGPEDMRA
ncbi:MAG: penicillin acylase family protein, partial [Alphaproteobacteria bacterium]|nr:penicillin acylase family protein [Alphaproteobacteria bacterium]